MIIVDSIEGKLALSAFHALEAKHLMILKLLTLKVIYGTFRVKGAVFTNEVIYRLEVGEEN